MPRVRLKRREYKVKDFGAWLAGQMFAKGISQSELGEWLGITQPAAGSRIKNGLFSYGELLIIFEKLETPDAEIVHLMKM